MSSFQPSARRAFLKGAAAAVLTPAGLAAGRAAAAEPPPEIDTIRLVHTPAICLAPQFLAAELLALEGFRKVEYVQYAATNPSAMVTQGRADVTMDPVPSIVAALDSGKQLLPLAGIHAGCYELFAAGQIRAVRDLKGKTVAVSALGAGDHLFLSSIAAYVGLDPSRDLHWQPTGTFTASMQQFVEGKADAFLGFAPQPQELRRRKIGRVIVDTTEDRPWSQYFCCMVTTNRAFATRYPNATRRALRAYLKAADLCANEPERVARFLADKGYEPRYDMSLEVLKQIPFRRWRQADPEDSLRFHALRLHEVGLIKTPPHKLLAQGTDWRFLAGLKRELKA